MVPIAGRYGPFLIYTFTLVMMVGIVSSLAVVAWRARRRTGDRLDGLLAAGVLALLGGRLAFVWAQWPYFQDAPLEALFLWRGGLSYHGALLVGLVTYWLWSVRQKRMVAAELDLIAPALALLHLFGWLACWFDSCAYGREALPGFLTADLRDSYGVQASRYQTQALGFLLSGAVFMGALWLNGRLPAGALFWLSLALLGAARIPVSILRGDQTLLLGSLQFEPWFDLTLTLFSLLKLVAIWRERRRNKQSIQT
jgi:phosphatidylglycerol---prolipoprotein diacylglyceryl transferase